MLLFTQTWGLSPSSECSTPSLLLLHGMGGIASIWQPIARTLEKKYFILAMDQRGHGASIHEKTIDYSPLEYGKDVLETLHTHFPSLKPVYIGHSMGVRTATAAAWLEPKRTSGLILIDLGLTGLAGGGLGTALERFLQKIPNFFHSLEHAHQFLLQKSPDPAIGRYLFAVLQMEQKRTASQKVPAQTPQPPHIRLPFDPKALLKTIKAAKNAKLIPWLKDLGEKKIPVLVLRGAKSLVYDPDLFKQNQKTLSLYPSILFQEIPNCGHGLPFEQKALFIKALEQFCNQIFSQSA